MADDNNVHFPPMKRNSLKLTPFCWPQAVTTLENRVVALTLKVMGSSPSSFSLICGHTPHTTSQPFPNGGESAPPGNLFRVPKVANDVAPSSTSHLSCPHLHLFYASGGIRLDLWLDILGRHGVFLQSFGTLASALLRIKGYTGCEQGGVNRCTQAGGETWSGGMQAACDQSFPACREVVPKPKAALPLLSFALNDIR